MRRLFPFSPRSAAKLVGTMALALLLGACAQLSSPSVPAKSQPAATAPLPATSPSAVSPSAPSKFSRLPDMTRSGTAAVLVPLSGPQAGLGTSLLNAAQMALFELGDGSFTVLSFDTHGTAEGAVQAAQQALAQHAEVIIGPVFSAGVKSITPIASQSGVPVLAFTADRTAAGNGVYVLGFLPGPQAARVAAQARAEGRTRLAVLAPSNEYGRVLVDYLMNTLSAEGGPAASMQFYEPGLQDWTVPLRRLVKPGAKTPGDVGFDALLLAEEGPRLHALAAALPAQGIDPSKVRLLGTMLWQNTRLGSDPALVGAEYAAPPTAGHVDFDQRYQQAFGGRPPRLASLGYDAMALAVVLARRSPHDYSAAALTNPSGFTGVDGLFRLLPDGTSERGYAVFQVDAGGNDREIAPAPAAFQAAY